jgi:hypothetical protein
MIDWERISGLCEEIGAESFDEVMELFLTEVGGVLDALEEGPGLKDAMHFLKGTALNLGFSEFAGLCAAGELAASTGSGQVDIAAVRASYRNTLMEFEAHRVARLVA